MSRMTRRIAGAIGLVAASAFVATGCTNASDDDGGSDTGNTATSNNDETGETVTIGFSTPAADHGWLAAISTAAQDEAKEYDDIDLQVAEGASDVNVQIQQVETFINDEVDAIVLLPHDGAALTNVAQKAMDAGIPVVNVDREFSSPFAARTTILGDNYGMGVSAGKYICDEADGDTDAVVAEIAGIDSLPLTQDRSQGFKDALDDCGLNVDNRVAADFTVEGGQRAASNLLQAAPEIDYLWNHDDDQGVGVMAAIEEAGRDEFTMVGGAGSKNMMELIKADNSPIKATVLYPHTQAADGIRLARLIAQDKALSDLVEVEVPREIVLSAPVVTKDNVDEYIDAAFES